MIVVSDASPLNFLIQLEIVDALQLLYGTVLVPEGVAEELQHERTPMEVRQWIMNPPGWVNVVKVGYFDRTLTGGLGEGERQAISLCLTHEGSLLLVDDLPARKSAVKRAIPILGVLGVAAAASVRNGYRFEDLVSRLQSLGFRASPKLLASAFARYRESCQFDPT